MQKESIFQSGLCEKNIQLNKNLKLRRLNGLQDIFFHLTTMLLLVIIFLFITTAISGILIKGIPGFWESFLSREIQYSLKLSLMTSLVSTFICLIISIPVAYALERNKIYGKALWNTIFDLPLALPHIASGLAILIMFGSTGIGKFLTAKGLKFIFTIKGIILTQVFVNISYMIRIIKSSIADINPRYEFVARTLGCNRLQAFLKITIPLAKNGIISGTIITFARTLGEFGAVLMVAGAVRMKTETLPISIFLNMSTGDLGLAMTAATILIFVSFISLLTFQLINSGNKIITRNNSFY